MKNLKKVVVRLTLFIFCTMLVIGNAVPAYANELPSTGKGNVTSIENVEGKNVSTVNILGSTSVAVRSLLSDGEHYIAFCLKSNAGSPTNANYKEVDDISDLRVAYDEEKLEILLNYPVIGNKEDFPVTNGDYFNNNYSADERDYYIRQLWVWAYQYKLENSNFFMFNTNYTDERLDFSNEIKGFFEKVMNDEVKLPTENGIKVVTPDNKKLEYNEDTDCYETDKYSVETIGKLDTNISVENIDTPSYMDIINTKDNSSVKEGEVVDEFYGSVTKEEFEKLPVNYEKVEVEGNVGLMSTYTNSKYKLYVNTNGTNSTQDLGVIVKEKQWIHENANVKATASVPKDKEGTNDNTNDNKTDNDITKENDNKADENDTTTDSSKTRDNNNIYMWLGIMTVSAIGAGIIIKKKRAL